MGESHGRGTAARTAARRGEGRSGWCSGNSSPSSCLSCDERRGALYRGASWSAVTAVSILVGYSRWKLVCEGQHPAEISKSHEAGSVRSPARLGLTTLGIKS